MRAPRRGFTLIELLIVVIILGLLVSFAVIRMRLAKDKAVIGTMTADLRALQQEQEGYYIQHRTYTGNLADLNSVTSPNNTLTIVEASATGWSAQAVNPAVDKICVVVGGNAAMIGGATVEGAITCQ